MLWREGYRPRTFEGLPLPANAPIGVFAGAFDVRGQAELGIWLRLFADAGLTDPSILLIRPTWTSRDRRLAEAVFAPSLHSRIRWVEDRQAEWQTLIQPDRPERGFAAIAKGPLAQLLVVGPPTEDVWERFEALAQS